SLAGDVAGEGGQDERDVLEKIPGQELEGEFADVFGGGGLEVGLHATAGGPDQGGGPALATGRAATDAVADCGQRLVDRIHGDGALRHIHNARALAVGEKTDRPDLAVFRLVEVRGDFRPVVPSLLR